MHFSVMKTASKPSHLVISSLANRQNLFQILLSPIVLYLYYGIGTYVELLLATSGRDGPQNTSHHSDATPNGTIPLEMSTDVVILQEDNMVPIKWPLAKAI